MEASLPSLSLDDATASARHGAHFRRFASAPRRYRFRPQPGHEISRNAEAPVPSTAAIHARRAGNELRFFPQYCYQF